MRQLRVVGWLWIALVVLAVAYRIALALVPGAGGEMAGALAAVALYLVIGVAGWYLRSGATWARILIGISAVAVIALAGWMALRLLGLVGSQAYMGSIGWVILVALGFVMPAYSLYVIIRSGSDTHLTSAST